MISGVFTRPAWTHLFQVLAFLAVLGLSCPETGKAEVRIIDDTGSLILLEGPARRIIPLYPGLTEILVSIGAGSRVVARTASDQVLPDPDLPYVGTHMRPNPELIGAFRPDLVVQMDGRDEVEANARAVSAMGIPVARFRLNTFEDVLSCMERLGTLTGQEAAASQAIRTYRQRLERLDQAILRLNGPPSVFFEVRYPNLLGAGGGGIVGDIIRRSGGTNLFEGVPEKFVRPSEELLAALDPDIYIIQKGPMHPDPMPLAGRSHFSGLRAARTGWVLQVEDSFFSRPGPSSIAAAEILTACIFAWAALRESREGKPAEANPSPEAGRRVRPDAPDGT